MKVESTLFHYVACGDRSRRPLLFLHGFMGSAEDWLEDIISFFSNEFFCIVVDLPGHGQTAVVNETDYRMENCAGNLMALLDDLHISGCDVVGYSMGGRLGLYLAVSYPERFGRLVLESASPGLRTKEERTHRVRQDENLARRLEKQPLEPFVTDWHNQPLFASLDTSSERFQTLVERRLRNDKAGLSLSLRMMGVGAQPSLWDGLDRIKADLLLIVGQKDTKFRRIASEMRQRCPTAQVRVVEDAGHNVHFENPERYAKEVCQFLKA